MKYTFVVFVLIVIMAFAYCIPSSSIAQTPGTLTFSVKTTEPPGGYTGLHVIALWIEDTNGVFIKTKMRFAKKRIQYLDRWMASSAYDSTDAITGATLIHQDTTLTFMWNGTDVSGNVVADKPYRIWLQMSDRDLSGATDSVNFIKDTSIRHLTPADTGNFINMVLDWNPSIGINEIESKKLSFRCEPNPFSETANVHYTLSQNSDVTLYLLDESGKTVAILFDDNQSAGTYTVQLSARSSQLKPGVYYLRINNGHIIETKKIVLAD